MPKLNTRHTDTVYWFIFLALIGFSLISLFTSSSSSILDATAKGYSPIRPVIKQFLLLGVGIGFAYALQFIPSWVYRPFGYLTLFVGIIFLILNACHVGVLENGVYRRIYIGGFTIQSSELAKLGLIIVVSDLLTRIRDDESRKNYYIAVIALTFLVCGLILLGNLSTAVLLFGVIFLMMILAKLPWKWLAGLIAFLFVMLICGYFYVEFNYVRPHKTIDGPLHRATLWVERFDNKYIRHEGDSQAVNAGSQKIRVTDDNCQVVYANVAVARGGLAPWGVGPGNSLESTRLPLANADYIFSIIVEETGLVGPIILIFLYLALLFRACYTSSRYDDYKAQLMVMGLGLMITLQAFVSMAVAVDFGPVTGQPLPLISKGGTSAIITSIYFGMMMGVSREQKTLQAQERATIIESENNIPDIQL